MVIISRCCFASVCFQKTTLIGKKTLNETFYLKGFTPFLWFLVFYPTKLKYIKNACYIWAEITFMIVDFDAINCRKWLRSFFILCNSWLCIWCENDCCSLPALFMSEQKMKWFITAQTASGERDEMSGSGVILYLPEKYTKRRWIAAPGSQLCVNTGWEWTRQCSSAMDYDNKFVQKPGFEKIKNKQLLPGCGPPLPASQVLC